MTPRPSLLLLALTACTAPARLPPEADSYVAKKPPPVQAAPPQPEFFGIVTSKSSKTISAPFQGRIQKVEVRHGQRVRKGDPIVRLDDSDLKNQIAAEKANEEAALAEAGAAGAGAGGACRKAEAIRKAVQMKARSQMDLTVAQAECSAQGATSGVGMARARSARQKRAILERQLEQTVITAPVDGVMMALKMKEGAIANQGDPLARIADPSDLWIKFPVEKEFRTAIQRDARVELRIDGVERTLWAKIDRITNEEAPIEFATVEADLDDTKLGPDEVQLAAEVHVRLAQRTGAVR